jgi:hypothetical protein
MTAKEAAEFAPIATATIAFVGACVAIASIFYQGLLARRRASIDFFIKFETDEKMIDLYNTFLVEAKLIAQGAPMSTIISSPNHQKVRSFLHVCELAAVGVRQRALSENISFAYWGDVLRDSFRDARPLIEYIRTQERSAAFCSDLEWLSVRWKDRT